MRGSTSEELLAIDWLKPHFIDEAGNMLGSIHALVLDAGEKRLIVDTCVGNGRERDRDEFNMLHTPFLEDLINSGYQ